MSQIFTGKIKSAQFVNPPQNSIIELLYGEANELTAFHLEVNYSNQEFLDFIEEWPLEKIEKAAREAARERAQLKENYDKQIIDTYRAQLRAQLKEDYDKQIIDEISNIKKDMVISCKDIFNYINENNKDRSAVFDLKLFVLEHNMDLKDKKLKLRIRKAKTILDLLQIYNETVK